jgi:predicted O-methyltransferase YrrM
MKMQLQRLLILFLAGVCITITGCAGQEYIVKSKESVKNEQTQAPGVTVPPAKKVRADVPYVPTPQPVVDTMLSLANVNQNDVLYDLGSGDGRIVITAAQKFGTRGTGIEIDPELIKEANANAQSAGVTDKVKFVQQDLFNTDFSNASVVSLYLLPDVNKKLRPKLLSQLKPGTRIVSHDFDMGEWKPDKVVKIQGNDRQHTVYYWTVPKK